MPIDRNEYIKMCHQTSLLNYKNVPDDLLVMCDDIKYIPFAYIMCFHKGMPRNIASLYDMNGHSVMDIELERVEKYEQRANIVGNKAKQA